MSPSKLIRDLVLAAMFLMAHPGCSDNQIIEPQNTDFTDPDRVTDLTVTAATESTITLAWTAPGRAPLWERLSVESSLSATLWFVLAIQALRTLLEAHERSEEFLRPLAIPFHAVASGVALVLGGAGVLNAIFNSGFSATQVGLIMAGRIDAVTVAVGLRVSALRSMWDAQSMRTRLAMQVKAATVQAALGDLRLRYLPPVPDRSAPRRLLLRLNPLSMQRVTYRRNLTAYWTRTWTSILRFEWWRINPVTFSRNLIVDSRNAFLFFYALMWERF